MRSPHYLPWFTKLRELAERRGLRLVALTVKRWASRLPPPCCPLGLPPSHLVSIVVSQAGRRRRSRFVQVCLSWCLPCSVTHDGVHRLLEGLRVSQATLMHKQAHAFLAKAQSAPKGAIAEQFTFGRHVLDSVAQWTRAL